jgi:hypothetical protein
VRGLVATVLLGLLAVVPAAAQSAAIAGRVIERESGRPLTGVTVTLHDQPFQIVTDEAGRFSVTQLASGWHHLEFRRLGYATRRDSVRVAAHDAVELEVRLDIEAVGLAPIAVMVNVGGITAWLASRGFARRGLEGGAALHLDYDQLQHLHYQNLREVLRSVPGVEIRSTAGGGSRLLLAPDPRTRTGSCAVAVHLNGARVEFGRFNWTGAGGVSASRPVRFDDLLRVREVDGIELYGPENDPVASDSTCGTLLLWSARLRPTVNEEFTGAVRGTALDDGTGAPLAGVRVTLEGTGLSVVTDGNGRFELPSVLPGRYLVIAEYPDAERWQATVRVRAYSVVELELRVERKSRGLEGRSPAR